MRMFWLEENALAVRERRRGMGEVRRKGRGADLRAVPRIFMAVLIVC